MPQFGALAIQTFQMGSPWTSKSEKNQLPLNPNTHNCITAIREPCQRPAQLSSRCVTRNNSEKKHEIGMICRWDIILLLYRHSDVAQSLALDSICSHIYASWILSVVV